ncbi:hypothetical protein D9758_014946 [Tetrapyrgos nigripes]|uniref:Uncharacterized protein n=1 Tax=Tetrapyrgos nigripes TaxID=182062 RepID=A0A8H5CJM0_9AGAR|nr:hypothetical protein D9758_014946 [Tetrapyrgos nigripes]
MGAGDSQPQPIGLRRRLGVLERAHSLTSHVQSSEDSRQKTHHNANENHAEETSGNSHSSLTDYESNSSSESEDDDPEGAQTPVPEPRYQAEARSTRGRPDPPPYPSELKTRAWYEFDLVVIAALVMPIGNWLTGGEHVKNVLVILLIVFYLHQVIEVPWSLYQKSRPRQHPSTSIPSPTSSKEYTYYSKATSELRFYEFLFLLLAAASPFLGLYALRYLSQIFSDADILPSWFSTSLFVLATGIRPWSHLIQRLNRRITDLHDIVHYPTPDSSSETTEILRSELQEMQTQMRHMQKAFADLHSKFVKDTEEVYDYVDDAVEMVEKSVKRRERKCEKQEGRVKDLEVSVDSLAKLRRPRPQSLSFGDYPQTRMSATASLTPLSPKVISTISYITSALPPWLPKAIPLPSFLIPSSLSSSYSSYSSSRDYDLDSNASPPQYEPKYSPSATVTRYSVLSLSSPDGLATIPESEETSTSMQGQVDGGVLVSPTSPTSPMSPISPSGSAGSASSSSSSGNTAGVGVSRLRGGHSYSRSSGSKS